jgi:hypothetical protein
MYTILVLSKSPPTFSVVHSLFGSDKSRNDYKQYKSVLSVDVFANVFTGKYSVVNRYSSYGTNLVG